VEVGRAFAPIVELLLFQPFSNLHSNHHSTSASSTYSLDQQHITIILVTNMATPEVETNSNHNEQQEPVIKQEPFEKWELPREVDLISDDGSQDDAAISGNERAQTTTSMPRTGANPAKASVKKRVASTADLMALQQKLADKYRTQNPNKPANMPQKQRQPEPEPEPEPESESEDENAKYEQAKKVYMRKKKAKKLSVEEELAFMKLESDCMARKRKAEADAEYDRSPSDSGEDDDDSELFVSEHGPRFSEMNSDDESDKPKKRRRGHDSDDERPQKRRGRGKKVLGQNYTEDDVTEIIRGARRQTKSTQKGATKAKAKPKAASNPKGKKKGGQETQITNLSNLFGGDVFRDHAATADLRSQPKFADATRKDDAMKKLIASVPQESIHVSRADMRHLDAAMKEFTGQGSVHAAPDGNWEVKGMKTTLKHFQVLGCGFARQRETQPTEPRGGILADEMGLGKTITMIANIVNGRPSSRSNVRTTLVVASPALISQWFNEIRAHCYTAREHKHGLGKVMVYKAGNRIKSNDDAGFLEEADVVLTTYYEVAKSYPKAIVPAEKVSAKQKEDWWREYYEQEKGILHQIKFLRVCLDEAQAIKNRMSHTSMACRALRARHRWCITGTPLLNSISEMYPYLAFIREPNTGSYRIFKSNFCSANDPDGKDKLGVLLRRLMIRRGI
jgi:SNF2 family DNA or RNA helicase